MTNIDTYNLITIASFLNSLPSHKTLFFDSSSTAGRPARNWLEEFKTPSELQETLAAAISVDIEATLPLCLNASGPRSYLALISGSDFARPEVLQTHLAEAIEQKQVAVLDHDNNDYFLLFDDVIAFVNDQSPIIYPLIRRSPGDENLSLVSLAELIGDTAMPGTCCDTSSPNLENSAKPDPIDLTKIDAQYLTDLCASVALTSPALPMNPFTEEPASVYVVNAATDDLSMNGFYSGDHNLWPYGYEVNFHMPTCSRDLALYHFIINDFSPKSYHWVHKHEGPWRRRSGWLSIPTQYIAKILVDDNPELKTAATQRLTNFLTLKNAPADLIASV